MEAPAYLEDILIESTTIYAHREELDESCEGPIVGDERFNFDNEENPGLGIGPSEQMNEYEIPRDFHMEEELPLNLEELIAETPENV